MKRENFELCELYLNKAIISRNVRCFCFDYESYLLFPSNPAFGLVAKSYILPRSLDIHLPRASVSSLIWTGMETPVRVEIALEKGQKLEFEL